MDFAIVWQELCIFIAPAALSCYRESRMGVTEFGAWVGVRSE